MTELLRETNREHWLDKIREWQVSGTSARSWALERGISPSTFGYWKKRLHATKSNSLQLNKDSFVEIQKDLSSDPGLTLEIQGVVVRVIKDFDSATLKRCLLLLRSL